MISKIYTYRKNPVAANELILYRFLAAMITIRKFKKLSLPKLQVYLWGLKNDENKQTLIAWKKQQKITNAPWMIDDDVQQIITQSICNRYVKAEQNKSGSVSYTLDFAATTLLQEIKNSDIERYIMQDLDEIGNLTDKMLFNITFDF